MHESTIIPETESLNQKEIREDFENYEYNPHTTAIVMKEIVRRVTTELRKQRFTFEAKIKTSDYSSDPEDLITTADHAAQRIILHSLKENFPNIGIIAEEDFACEPKEGSSVYVTVDPLDGTKAFGHRHSDGSSTMISYIENDQIEGAWIGDVNTHEMYYTRPGSKKVHRISDLEISENFESSDKPLSKMPALLKGDPRRYSKLIQKITDPKNRIVKDIDIQKGSIGLTFAKLWKEEVGLLIKKAQPTTPWDLNPCYCISKKLGYKFYRVVGNDLIEYEPKPVLKIEEEEFETLVIHESRVEELLSQLAKIKDDQ